MACGTKLVDLDRHYSNGLIQFSDDHEANTRLMMVLKKCSDTLASLFLDPVLEPDLDPVQPDDNFKKIFRRRTTARLRKLTDSLYQALIKTERHCIQSEGLEAHSTSVHISPFGRYDNQDGSEEFLIMLRTHSKPCTWQEGRVCVKQNK